MTSAYLILCDIDENLSVEGVYLGKQPGAEKAMAALRTKANGRGSWDVQPIEIVDTFGGQR